EGRGLGTKGLDLAADYIADQFRAIGLKTELYDGQPFQKFSVTTSSKLGPAEKNTLRLVGPGNRSATTESDSSASPSPQPSPVNGEGAEPNRNLKLGVDFSPLAVGVSGKIDAPVVFAGYGITAPKLDYDDYAGLDVKGKAVIVLRHEPQQNDPHSA